MHRLWSDGRWNKLTDRARLLLEAVHVLRHHARLHLALRSGAGGPARRSDRGADRRDRADRVSLRRRGGAAGGAARAGRAARSSARSMITWWGNIRFEKTFTPELARAAGALGCVALSGGLEVASDRLLERMKKGVTVAQVARVTRAFTDGGHHGARLSDVRLSDGDRAGDTIDALERVRQLFAAGCVQSAFWHRFAATAHSPIGRAAGAVRHPAARRAPRSRSRSNDLAFDDPTGCDHDLLRRRACARRSTTTCTASASTHDAAVVVRQGAVEGAEGVRAARPGPTRARSQ